MGAAQAEIRHRQVRNELLHLHIAKWTDRESASTVPHLEASPSADLATVSPGDDWDYLDGDGMVLIAKNHVLFLSSGIQSLSLQRYLNELLKQAQEAGATVPENDVPEFIAIANPKKIKQIYDKGQVKSVNLKLGQYLESAKSNLEQTETILQRVARTTLLALIQDEDKRKAIGDAENVNAMLTISLDRKRKGIGPVEFSSLIQELASDDEDGVVIETLDGTRINSGNLFLRRKVKIEEAGKTVQYSDAWLKMTEYYESLKQQGF